MFKILWYCFCTYVVLVKSQNQYQLVSTYPYNTQSYGSLYGSQPVVMQPTYSQQYIVQNPATNYQTTQPPIANQIQEMYLNRLLSNPAIQAFIDPSTKIYNQNGIEISDQIRPKGTPNVVNNYFIVPTDYLKNNESVQRDVRRNNNKMSSVTYTPKMKTQTTPTEGQQKEGKKGKIVQPTEYKSSKPKEIKRINNERINKNKKDSQNQEFGESTPRKTKKTRKKLNERDMTLNDPDVIEKQKTNIKRQDNRTPIHTEVVENHDKKVDEVTYQAKQESGNKRDKSIKKDRHFEKDIHSQIPSLDQNVETKSNTNLPQKTFDICEECTELDNRNIRNSADNIQNSVPHKKSSKTQDNFMKQWMSYIKSFAPNQNFDSFDFSPANMPYNFDQMYQLPKFPPPTANDNQNHTKKRKRKHKRKNKKPEDSKSNCNNKTRKTTIELVPKFIEFESDAPIIDHVKKEVIAKPDLETFTHSLEATHYVPNVSTEDSLPIMYDIIDYYPDFTQDTIYASDEDDLYLFHNRHFYNMNDEKELNRERRKYERAYDENNIKHPENRIRVNDIHSSEKESKKAHIKPVFEDIKFQTPPALIEPGFETRKVNIRENNNYNTHYLDESNKPSHKHIDNHRNDVETVFARSKVVKYGQQGEAEAKVKVITEDHLNNDGDRKKNARNGDATVVFAESWH